jgi:two-component system sensor histidine kinase PilS (NtrC family)
MPDWLSTTWEANWRSFQYFNLYRLVLAALFCLSVIFPNEWVNHLRLHPDVWLFGLTGIYMVATSGGLLASIHWQHHFNFQLSAQMVVDVLVVTVLMHEAGGVASGLGGSLLVSLAAASLVGRGRLVLFYAALATLSVLGMQIYEIYLEVVELSSLLVTGLLCAAFFATAILARLLGQRVMTNEELARRRGIELDNQVRISQRIVERMQDGVLILTPDGFVSRCNPVAGGMLGLPIGGEVFSIEIRVPMLSEALQAWRSGGAGEVFNLAGVGGRELQVRFEPTSSSDGEILVFLEDIGRIKERAHQLKLASLGRLTASIAHEIRNPLSAIGHAGELLREERRGAMQERLLRIIQDNVIRLDRIVQDVLELGRQSRAQPELLKLAEFCAVFVEDFRSTEEVQDGVILLESERDLELCFDRMHLQRVLWNLVGNALRHSRREAGSVRLRIVESEAPGWVELHVQDDGPGVPEKVRDQIFEPFFTTHKQGNGLGLFIARELCVNNGATLELAPSDSGAHFIVSGRNDTCLVH